MSLVNAQLPHIYTNPSAALADIGFVMSDNVTFECAMTYDGGTVMDEHGGCAGRCVCGQPMCYWCVYLQSQISDFLGACLHDECNGGPCRDTYNEVVAIKQSCAPTRCRTRAQPHATRAQPRHARALVVRSTATHDVTGPSKQSGVRHVSPCR